LENDPHSGGGSGGVIDGTILDSDSKLFNQLLTGKNVIGNVYTVKNNCALYLGYDGNITDNNRLIFYIGGSMILSLNSNGGDKALNEGAGGIVHVKKGAIIQASVSEWSGASKATMVFIEYKLV